MIKFVLIGFFTFLSSVSFSQNPDSKRPTHSFNAFLLEKNEKQISIFSTARYGVSEDLELGTNFLMAVLNIPNLAVKHRMFNFEDHQTSFISHIGVLTEDDLNTFGYWGINHSWVFDQQTVYSFGFMNLFLRSRDSFFGSKQQSFDGYSVNLSADYSYSKRTAFNATLLLPVFVNVESKLDVADLEYSEWAFLNFRSSLTPVVFLSSTFTFGVFNLEPGLIAQINNLPPGLYINLFWRW